MWNYKGQQRPDFAIEPGRDQESVWDYPRPRARYDSLKVCVSFYPGRIACFVGGERVAPQPGHFYGGWITSGVVGPFKGEPGTGHW